jgi:hypothetical protein
VAQDIISWKVSFNMTHAEFVKAYADGRIKVTVDPTAAAKYLSARLMLPFFMMPVLGAGIALALLGRIWAGLAVIAVGFFLPRLIKRSAPNFVLNQAVKSEHTYQQVMQAGILRITTQD